MTYSIKINLLYLTLLQSTLFSVGVPLTSAPPADYTYVPATNNYYKLHMDYKTRKTWGDAVAVCESEGAWLYYPENAGDFKDVSNALGVWDHFYPTMWVGMSDLEKFQRYKLVDGRFLTSKLYHEWDRKHGQPGHGPRMNRNCGLIYHDGKLWLEECDSLKNFVCKYKQEGNITTTTVQTTSN